MDTVPRRSIFPQTQQIFSGRDVPPPQKSEAAVISFVRSNENAIAYVSAGADTAGLKVITVGD